MDYELMMNGNVKIGQKAPDFIANTTYGQISLNQYIDKWVVLFSYSGDFLPVCTTEMIALSRANKYFKELKTELIGLSVDSNHSHLAWMHDIYYNTGVKIPFPIIADRNGEIARKYGMISQDISPTQTVRNIYIIDPKGIIRAILIYPVNVRKIYTRNNKNNSSASNSRLHELINPCKLVYKSTSNTRCAKYI